MGIVVVVLVVLLTYCAGAAARPVSACYKSNSNHYHGNH